ncbi:MAG: hypothetical protein K9M80_01870 [Candidatus Marinimicrobia bacterium]|nr:hypothetical protein [Candidatus Neomarinimicrobiota bacterium]
MDYIKAHKEFLKHIKHENTSTVEPTEFEFYFNRAQHQFVRDNYMMGSDAKQTLIDNIQHLRLFTDGKHKWKTATLDPIASLNGYSIDLFTDWNAIYKNENNTDIKAPKYLRLANIQVKIQYGSDDPCNRTGISEWKDAHYLKAGQRNLINNNSLRGKSNDRVYYYLANNKIYFELFGSSQIYLVKLEFYRYPVDIAYNNGTGSQNPDNAAYPEYGASAEIIDPELSDEDTEIILAFAARYYLEGVQSARIQTFQ